MDVVNSNPLKPVSFEFGKTSLTYSEVLAYVESGQGCDILQRYEPTTQELKHEFPGLDEACLLEKRYKGLFTFSPLKELKITKNKTMRGIVRFADRAPEPVVCAIAELNLSLKLDKTQFPIQQLALISRISRYVSDPFILPWCGTQTGRAPKREARDWIAALLKIIFSNTCFYTWRIGAYRKNGDFRDMSLLELAKQGGFTKIVRRPIKDKNGNVIPSRYEIKEVVERGLLRAWKLLRDSGYIKSHQPRQAPSKETESGWHKSYKILNRRIIGHLRKDAPANWLPVQKINDLTKAAKKRAFALEKKTRANRIKDVEASKQHDPIVRETLGKLHKLRAAFVRVLTQLGYVHATAVEFATLRYALPYNMIASRTMRFGNPSI